MNWNEFFFATLPYVALTVAVVVTIYRFRYRPLSITSLSSQLLEGNRLFWGSIPFHWGLSLILLVHLLALLVPEAILAWNGNPLRLYLLEISGFALGLWALVGSLILLIRRLSAGELRIYSSPVDVLVLILLIFQIVTGLWTATYRFGSTWGAAVLTPYLRSVLSFRPNPDLVAEMPLAVKLHIGGLYALLLVFPFSRLIHILTLPLGYLVRPWQIVIRLPKRQTVN
jgi:nitrate reductase gamma subunit